jgi:hypothetical protein
MTNVRQKPLLVGIFVGTLAFMMLLVGYVCLGMFTRVIAICGGAAAWWANTYFICALAIPIGAIWSGLLASRASSRRHINKFGSVQE